MEKDTTLPLKSWMEMSWKNLVQECARKDHWLELIFICTYLVTYQKKEVVIEGQVVIYEIYL